MSDTTYQFGRDDLLESDRITQIPVEEDARDPQIKHALVQTMATMREEEVFLSGFMRGLFAGLALGTVASALLAVVVYLWAR